MQYPLLILPADFDPLIAQDVEEKGWYGLAIAQLENGDQFELIFYEPKRLYQDLEIELNQEKACVTEPGLIVIPRVTRLYMEKALRQLHQDGYFQRLAPLTKP
jgi:thiamine monophosphate kinase